MEVILSYRGNNLIIENGYIFEKNRERDTATHGRRIYWRCREPNCGATVITGVDFVYQGRGKTHTHEGDPLKVSFFLNLWVLLFYPLSSFPPLDGCGFANTHSSDVSRILGIMCLTDFSFKHPPQRAVFRLTALEQYMR